MPRRASGTRTSPSSGNSFSRASGSSGTTSENGVTSTRVRGGTRIPDARASVSASLPINSGAIRPSG